MLCEIKFSMQKCYISLTSQNLSRNKEIKKKKLQESIFAQFAIQSELKISRTVHEVNPKKMGWDHVDPTNYRRKRYFVK